MAKARAPFVSLAWLVAAQHPTVECPEAAIRSGRVQVDGAVVANPAARVRRDAAVRVSRRSGLHGAQKLAAALDHFGVSPRGRTALDLGAAAGGFTSVLLERGAAIVYAVDAGHGQMLGSLRQDPRVRNLERTNVADLSPDRVPEVVSLVTMDLSYLPVAAAVAQVEAVRIADNADLVALVKPMFELGLGALPTEPGQLDAAVRRAAEGVERMPWQVAGAVDSPVPGRRGAAERLLHARRAFRKL